MLTLGAQLARHHVEHPVGRRVRDGPRPPHTPDTEEHTRIRASGRSGHTLGEPGQPADLGGDGSGERFRAELAVNHEGRRRGGVDDQRRTVPGMLRGGGTHRLGRRQIALRGQHLRATSARQVRDGSGVDTAAAEQHKPARPGLGQVPGVVQPDRPAATGDHDVVEETL